MIEKLPTTLLIAVALASSAVAKTTKHDFKSNCVAEVYKEASGDKLWIYRFDPSGKSATAKPAVVFFFGGGLPV